MSSTSVDPPEGGSSVNVSGLSVEPALDPTAHEADVRAASFFGTFTDHYGFERRFRLAGVTSNSKVFVSICELGVFGGQVKPFQGLASMEIHSVVPHDDGIVVVRGYIGWDANLNVRLSFFVA